MKNQVAEDREKVAAFATKYGLKFELPPSDYFIGTVNGAKVERNRKTGDVSFVLDGIKHRV